MRSNYLKATLKTAALAVTVLLLGAGVSFAQSVNLTAAPTTATLPDGQVVPMWGYTCGAPVAGSAGTCAALNSNAAAGTWSPVVISVPFLSTGTSLTIRLTNSLPGTVPTSLMIVGQLGGGLGTSASTTPSPSHPPQSATWPIAGNATGPQFTPPTQGPRVQSFSTEVATGVTTILSWTGLKPGTYLIESGTHPSIQGPMGLYGVLVVTNPANGTTLAQAYPGVSYDADAVMLLSEIDAAQNAAVAQAVVTPGFSETAVWKRSNSGGPVTSITVTNPGLGYALPPAAPPNVSITPTAGGGGSGAVVTATVNPSDGSVTLTLMNGGDGYSSAPAVIIDPPPVGGTQARASSTITTGGCGGGAHTCYPPAVNYDPRYYLVNGVAFDRTNAAKSQFSIAAPPSTGQVLVRFVNAGLRMHVPSIVGAQTTQTVGTTTSVVSGFSLIAEDGNVLPGTAKVQSEVFLAAGKTYDVLINAPPTGAPALPVFDRQLSLSTNNQRDGGMQAYISVNAGSLPSFSGLSAIVNPDSYVLVSGKALTVSDPTKGVVANDVGVYGVGILTAPTGGTITLNADGTFTYVPNSGTTSDSFVYEANGNPALTATVTLGACTGICLGGAPTANADAYTSAIASRLQVSVPGVLGNDTDPAQHPLTAVLNGAAGVNVTLNPDGSFVGTRSGAGVACPTGTPAGATCATFMYHAVNSQNTSSGSASVTLTFLKPSGLTVKVYDSPSFQLRTPVEITDYRWIIEEDRTFKIDPACQVNSSPRPAGCPPLPVPSLGTNFHSSYMPVIASGCVGTASCESGQTVLDLSSQTHLPAVCDVGNGACRTAAGAALQQYPVDPSQVALDPAKHYYISILPGDAGNSFTGGAGAPQPVDPNNPTGPQRPFSIALDCPSGPGGADFAPGTGTCGHGMGGAPIVPSATAVNVLLQETPIPTTKVAVFVFEDDNSLNGEHDAAAAAGSPIEPGLGGFEITLFDDAGGTGDPTGQMTYDMFNMPLSNSLAGTIDPVTGKDACPISPSSTDGLVGMIVTCPNYESDGTTVSPLAGQAVIANMMPGRYGVVATPAADRIARGEEWLQTNTLDGQKAHDSFIKVRGPSYFQEFGPPGFHVAVGFANPAIINARNPHGRNSITGRVTTSRISRTPDQRLYSSGSRDAFGFTQCYVSLGDPNGGADFAFSKCNGEGQFTLTGVPDGNWRITIFDQWNDQIVDGLATPVLVSGGQTLNMGDIPVQQWHTNIYTRSFIDLSGDGVSQDSTEPGLALVPTNIRFRDGSFSNFNNTDLNGFAGFNEIFPLFNWYVIETDSTRYKQTGVHVVYDAGGPADGTPGGGTSTGVANFANTIETNHLPTNLRVPGAVYCANADCGGASISTGVGNSSAPSTGRIDPPWVTTEAWQGFIGQNELIEFGKKLFAGGENGGIKGHVIYASTRPFDDPTLLLQTSWMPMVPGVTVNLYQEGTAADGTQSLTLADTTKTSSWDAWAQGFHPDATGNLVPNMNCPGQDTTSPFYFTLRNTTQWLNPTTPLPNNSQYKCYDGMHMFNQVQPAPYDGMYKFPSVTGISPTTGKPAGTNCTICQPNRAVASADWDYGLPMLPPGKYVVEVVVPPGYELVKEEDKNILIGDNYIAPVTQQFGGLGSIFILPDQAEVNSQYNPYNALNPTQNLGSQPRHEGDTGSVESFWPCVGQRRIVPDYISLFPYSAEVAPFAGASRNLCDRKEVTLEDQSSALAKFYIFSSTHVAGHYAGIITDDFASEFDPFSPQFGEKFAVPNLPISFKDFDGVEISRTYSDQWGFFSGLNYSTWEVNPPNPTGYAPAMMVSCMNDPGNGPTPDPLYNPSYSQFCYETPFMPGQTQYMDTPVVPTAAFAEGYNPPDCAYPDATPAILSILGDTSGGGAGPWVSQAGHTLTINALGDQQVPDNAYTGPSSTTAPFNQKFITRHYGFGPRQGGRVTIGGANAPVTSWSDTQITVTVPPGVPLCNPPGQAPGQAIYHGPNATARCGELEITAGNGKKSIDTVMVTVGGNPPTYINGENAANNAIQTALDNATPGDLIIVGPGTYKEILLMWRPVRLQGVGAASVKVNANTHPSGKMDVWRRKVNCLFGLALNGSLLSAGNVYDPTGTYTCPGTMQGAVDPLPAEEIVGWNATLNGNLAELLQEPTLMGALEGAAITVLAKGENLSISPSAVEGNFPAGSRPLTNSLSDCNGFQSNFLCNPSRIDGITFTNSSQGGGGIVLHGWNHFTEVSNNRVFANAGTLTGGITVGQIDAPVGTIVGTQQAAYLFNTNVRVHHNSITQNASYGDLLTLTTASGAGGVTFCTGSDYYEFNHNWVCGNLSSVSGGGFAHLGFSYNGKISNNWFLFNQTNNPSIPTNGGGVVISGELDGAGRGLMIDSNLIMGNTAENGTGGGLRLESVNGSEVVRNGSSPGNWYEVTVTNNIIANNVAGWDGGGVSLQDALKVNFINNTVISNDTTASSGMLFNTPGSSTVPQVAGLVAMRNSPSLFAGLPATATVTCPSNYQSGECRQVSNPVLQNDVFWQNRTFNIQVGGPGPGTQNQQNLVTLVPALNQARTGDCPNTPSYWDIGMRGDASATPNSGSGFALRPTFSILTNAGNYPGANNLGSDPAVVSKYCNGSRVPPENGGLGYDVPPGMNDVILPNPVFNLSPAATVDEGNNWVNMNYGPLSLFNAAAQTGSPNYGVPLGNYSITGTSPAIDNAGTGAPNHDFFGTSRPQGSRPDIGAVEFNSASGAVVNPMSLSFSSSIGVTSAPQTVTVNNTGTIPLTVTATIVGPGNPGQFNTSACTPSPVTPGSSCTVSVTFTPTASGLPSLSRSARLSLAFPGSGVTTVFVSLSGTILMPTYTVTTNGANTNTPLAFGNQVRGTISAAQTATITNTSSNGATITVNSTPLAGTSSGQFARTPACTGLLAAGASCTINVTFNPGPATALGSKTATLTVNVAAPATTTGSNVVSLSGTAVARPTLSYTGAPGTLGFGTATFGTASNPQSRTVTLNNPAGNATLTGINVTASGADYSRPAGAAGGTCSATLSGGTTCTVILSLTSTSADHASPANPHNGTLTITDSEGLNPPPVNLTGTAN